MSESICSGFVGKNSSEATGTHSTEGVPSTINEGALSVDDHEHVSGIVASAERYLMAWRQVVTDRHNSDILYETIRESYSRESWTTLGYQTFGAFCRDRLGVGENELSDILISRFGMKRFRLLTVSARQQGRRNDLERTSRSDCGKFDLRMDTTVRTTLVAIERAPELECLVTSDLLPWALGAKLGSDDLSETQINKVKQLGAQVAELMAVPVAEAKRRIRQEVEAIIGKRKSAATQLAERLRKVSKDDLREALASVPHDLLRQVLPPELLGDKHQESFGDLAEPLPSEGQAQTSDDTIATEASVAEKLAPEETGGDVLDDSDGDDAGDGASPNGASEPEDQNQVATEGTDSAGVGAQSDLPHQVGSSNRAKQLRQGPDWDRLENALARPLDAQIGELGPDTSGVSRLLLSSSGLQLRDILGEDIALFRAKTINHRRSHITSAASSSHMHELADGEGAPAGAAVAFVYVDESGNICSEGYGRVSEDGQLPEDLVFVLANTRQALVIVRGPRRAPCFGAEAAVMVHRREVVIVREAPE